MIKAITTRDVVLAGGRYTLPTGSQVLIEQRVKDDYLVRVLTEDKTSAFVPVDALRLPRLIATFRPQAWVGPKKDNLAEAGPPVEFDVTDEILKLSRIGLRRFKENNYDSDDLASDLPERRAHAGPFEVDVDIDAWLEELGFPERKLITTPQWEQVKAMFPPPPAEARKVITVPVLFRGEATIEVPAHLPEDRQRQLANKLVLAQMLATLENPDCGECLERACEEYADEAEIDKDEAERDFEKSLPQAVSGCWTIDTGLPHGGSHAPDCPYRVGGECLCWRSDPTQNPELT